LLILDAFALGHNLIQPGTQYLPNVPLNGSLPTGLELQSGYTLALIGGDINFKGGIITAPSGRIEIGSVSSGQVSINPSSLESFSLSYGGIQNYHDILLERQSLLNASGLEGGNINFAGRNVRLTDSSLAFIENRGFKALGAINVNASNSLIIDGNTAFTPILPNLTNFTNGLISQTFNGKGAGINIFAKEVVVQNSGRISLLSFGSGATGSLNVNVSDSVNIFGTSPFDPDFPSGSTVSTASAGAGQAGDILLNTRKLSLQNGGSLASVAFSQGGGGNVFVNASESIDLAGVALISFIPSTITSETFSFGKAGNLFINTKQMSLQNGGRVDSSTLASGAAGSVSINATDFIEVSGKVQNSINPSLIVSSANRVDPILQQLFTLPSLPSGASGSITINTGRLSVTNGAQVTVRNDGGGDAGTLLINANSINLDNQGGITATTTTGNGGSIFLKIPRQLKLDHNSLITATAGGQGTGGNITIDSQQTNISNGSGIAVNSTGTGNAGQLKISSNSLTLNNGGFLSANTNGGEGGNIFLNARNLQLRHSSLFTAAALKNGNGGNININTGTLAALENSRISADAVRGNGGNIQINAQGIFQSPDSRHWSSNE